MSTFISNEIREGLDAARMSALKKASRLRIMDGDDTVPVLKMWDSGFSVEAATSPALRGLVDIFEGSRHLLQCLIVASESEAGEMRYEFKRNTRVTETAPLDFYRDPTAPAGLLAQ